jgi:hypothetical protein
MGAFVLKTCSECNSEFEGFHASKYCSSGCNPRSPKKDAANFNCLNCDKLVVSRKRKNFCSGSCRSIYIENIYDVESQVLFVRFNNGNNS